MIPSFLFCPPHLLPPSSPALTSNTNPLLSTWSCLFVSPAHWLHGFPPPSPPLACRCPSGKNILPPTSPSCARFTGDEATWQEAERVAADESRGVGPLGAGTCRLQSVHLSSVIPPSYVLFYHVVLFLVFDLLCVYPPSLAGFLPSPCPLCEPTPSSECVDG